VTATGRPGDAGAGGAPPGLHRLLDRVRTRYRRLDAAAAAAAVADGAVLVDIRPDVLRARDGEVPGAVVIERNALEWRLAPSDDGRRSEEPFAGRTVIVLCADGGASSLAVASLQALGLSGATDVVGGFAAWRDAGLPVTAAHRARVLPFAAV
jgi:rhodanese-related sulfurtransferase